MPETLNLVFWVLGGFLGDLFRTQKMLQKSYLDKKISEIFMRAKTSLRDTVVTI